MNAILLQDEKSVKFLSYRFCYSA